MITSLTTVPTLHDTRDTLRHLPPANETLEARTLDRERSADWRQIYHSDRYSYIVYSARS